MKIQIDTENKTVRLEKEANLKFLFDFLRNVLGENFEDYSLITDKISVERWVNPIIIERERPEYPPTTWPWWLEGPFCTYDSTVGDDTTVINYATIDD